MYWLCDCEYIKHTYHTVERQVERQSWLRNLLFRIRISPRWRLLPFCCRKFFLFGSLFSQRTAPVERPNILNIMEPRICTSRPRPVFFSRSLNVIDSQFLNPPHLKSMGGGRKMLQLWLQPLKSSLLWMEILRFPTNKTVDRKLYYFERYAPVERPNILNIMEPRICTSRPRPVFFSRSLNVIDSQFLNPPHLKSMGGGRKMLQLWLQPLKSSLLWMEILRFPTNKTVDP